MAKKKKIEEEVKMLAEQTAMLLEISGIADDEKISWMTLIPEMSLEHIGKLNQYLASKVPDGASKEFEELKAKMQGVQDTHDAEKEKIDAAAMDKLAAIEEKLKPTE